MDKLLEIIKALRATGAPVADNYTAKTPGITCIIAGQAVDYEQSQKVFIIVQAATADNASQLQLQKQIDQVLKGVKSAMIYAIDNIGSWVPWGDPENPDIIRYQQTICVWGITTK